MKTKYDMGEPEWMGCDCEAMNLMLEYAADLHPLRCVSKRLAATPLSNVRKVPGSREMFLL